METLPPELASLVALSAAIAAGDSPGTRAEAERAIRAGAPASAVYEIVLQSYLFLGFPRAIEALFAVRPVLEPAGGIPLAAAPDDPPAWESAGRALCRRVYGANFEKLMETMRGLSPDLAAWMIREGYGKTLSRPALDPVAREYGVVAILTVTRMWRQLRSHAIGAVNVGGSRAGVRAAIEECRRWAGEPTIREAMDVTGLEGGNGGS